MTSARVPAPVRPRDGRPRARGLALVVALIVLAAMSVASAVLLHTVDTTLAVTGNLALRAVTAAATDAAIEEAVAALAAGGPIADRERDLPAQGYFAARGPGEDVRGVPSVLQEIPRYPAAARVLDPGDGATVRYVIERLCIGPGPPTDVTCALYRPATTPAGGAAEGAGAVPPEEIFRITVRADGPRNALAFVQATVRGVAPPRRVTWRLLVD
jgi:type IV pilus assembly protein PilX